MKKLMTSVLISICFVVLIGCSGGSVNTTVKAPDNTPSVQSSNNPSTPQSTTNQYVPPQTEKKEITVYITKTGKKYHSLGCRYLSRSCIPVALEEAQKYYTPCSVCNPPR